MKFEEAFNQSDDCVISIEEVKRVYNKDLEQYANAISNHLLCPECRRAQLCFVNAKYPYFRTMQNEVHIEGCSLAQEKAEYITIKDENDLKASLFQIKAQMKRIQIRLIAPKEKFERKLAKETTARPSSAQAAGNIPRIAYKGFQAKRLDAELSEEDCNVYKLFYGKFDAEWEFDKTHDRWKLLLRLQDELKLHCKITITPIVYKYLKEQGKVAENNLCL